MECSDRTSFLSAQVEYVLKQTFVGCWSKEQS